MQNITVVILSHNRQQCLLPSLEYWNEIGANVLVVDQSRRPLKYNKKLSNIKYIYKDVPFAERCAIAAEAIETKYSIMVADDELFLPSGLTKMEKTLDEHVEFASVGAMVLSIWQYGPLTAGAWAYRGTKDFVNDGESPLERVRLHTGGGYSPRTSFFTSNLNRSEYLQNCLELYSKAPVIATEAISILTICGGGKSKYLNELFWIRNWNEFPKSHSNWDRGEFLHNWWKEKRDTPKWIDFYSQLANSYSSFSSSNDFDELWDLILSASEVSQPSVDVRKYSESNWSDSYLARNLKYSIKKITNSSQMPRNYKEILREMKSQGVDFNQKEIDDAVRVVRKMRPYKNWK